MRLILLFLLFACLPTLAVNPTRKACCIYRSAGNQNVNSGELTAVDMDTVLFNDAPTLFVTDLAANTITAKFAGKIKIIVFFGGGTDSGNATYVDLYITRSGPSIIHRYPALSGVYYSGSTVTTPWMARVGDVFSISGKVDGTSPYFGSYSPSAIFLKIEVDPNPVVGSM